MPAAHPPQLRRRAVELARELDEDGNREYPLRQLARDQDLWSELLQAPVVRRTEPATETSGEFADAGGILTVVLP